MHGGGSVHQAPAHGVTQLIGEPFRVRPGAPIDHQEFAVEVRAPIRLPRVHPDPQYEHAVPVRGARAGGIHDQRTGQLAVVERPFAQRCPRFGGPVEERAQGVRGEPGFPRGSRRQHQRVHGGAAARRKTMNGKRHRGVVGDLRPDRRAEGDTDERAGNHGVLPGLAEREDRPGRLVGAQQVPGGRPDLQRQGQRAAGDTAGWQVVVVEGGDGKWRLRLGLRQENNGEQENRKVPQLWAP